MGNRELAIENEMMLRDEICGLKQTGDKKMISEELLGYSMFVEAGAGAGKTYTIVQRVLNQLCIGIKPSEIVVITFTNKAAEELRGRIASELRDRVGGKLNDNGVDYTEYKDQLSDALSHIDDMNISTIHSFCFKLLKQRCFDAVLPADIGLLDNEGTESQADEIFERFIAAFTYDDWDKLSDSDPNNKTRKQIKKDIKKIYDKVCTQPEEKRVHIEDVKKIEESRKEQLYREFEKVVVDMVTSLDMKDQNAVSLQGNVAKLEDVLAFLDVPETFLGANWKVKDGEPLIKYDENGRLDHKRFWKAFITDGGTGDKAKEEKVGHAEYRRTERGIFKQGNCLKQGKDDKEKIKTLYAGVYDFIDDHIEEINLIMNEQILNYRNLVCRYAQKAKEYYAENCSIQMLTNDALLERTRDMICEKEDAQKFFAEKYSCFYVDEFQDTDSIQESFIWRLASKSDDHNELRDGALFIVGDPKQSIYRFRGAEPQVYLDEKTKMRAIQEKGGNAKVYDLQINFRSNDLVINWVNSKFSKNEGFEPIMVSKNGDEYRYQNMLPKNVLASEDLANIDSNGFGLEIKRNDKESLLAGVYQLDKPDSSGTSYIENSAELKEDHDKRIKRLGDLSVDEKSRDLQDVTDIILNLTAKDSKYRIIKKGKKEKIKFSDFMVLCASKTNMNAYLDYMSLRGIPVQIAGSTDPKTIVEMSAFVRIYSYLANQKSQKDRIAAIEAFRILKISDKENELDRYAMTILDYMHGECIGKSAYSLAVYILDHLSSILRKNRFFSGFEIVSTQAKIMQMIETVCRDNYGTPKDIALKFKEYLENNIEHELSLEETTNAVRFMNIHKSKGLEGNIVIVADRHDGKDYVSDFWHDVGDENGHKLEFYPKAKQYIGLKEEEEKEQSAEKRRLEYVTATRAGQVLIFMDVISGKKLLFHGGDGAKYDLHELPSIAPVLFGSDPHTETEETEVDYSVEREVAEYHDRISSLNMEEAVPTLQRVSPSNFESGYSKTKAEALEESKRNGSGVEKTVLPRPIGNVFGTAMHRALELLVNRYAVIKNKQDMLDKVVDACVHQAVTESIELLSDDDVAQYLDFLTAVLKSYYSELKELHWLENCSDFHTELAFSYYEDQSEGEDNQLYFINKHLSPDKKLKSSPIWMNGSADLVIRFDAGKSTENILVVDYKSDNDNYLNEDQFHKSMSEKYIGQLDNYCYAMSKLYGISKDNISMKVVSFSQKDEQGQAYSDKKVRVRITKIAEAI